LGVTTEEVVEPSIDGDGGVFAGRWDLDVQVRHPVIGLVRGQLETRTPCLGVSGIVVAGAHTRSAYDLVHMTALCVGVDDRIELLIGKDSDLIEMPCVQRRNGREEGREGGEGEEGVEHREAGSEGR